jgi:YVTN family beta-propeller protein
MKTIKIARRHPLLAILAGLLVAAASHGAPFAYVTQADGNLSVIDLETNPRTLVATIALGGGQPTSAAALPGERYVYVTDPTRSRIALVDTLPQAVIAYIPVTNALHVVRNPKMQRAYVARGSGLNPSVIRTDMNSEAAILAAGVGSTRVEVNATGTRAYFSANALDALYVMDTATEAITVTIPTGAGPLGMAAHPTANRLYVANYGRAIPGNTVSVVDLDTNAIVATIPVGQRPGNVAVNPAGNFLFVSNEASNTVTVASAENNAVLLTIPVGVSPAGIQVDLAGQFAYVANTGSGTISVIAISTMTVVDTIVLPGAAPGPTAIGRFIGGAAPLAGDTPSILTGLWWNAAESGWGIHITQRREVVFAAWFTYDAVGTPHWYVASSCRMSAPPFCATCVANTRCYGPLFEVTGPRFFNAAFNPAAAQTSVVGNIQIEFRDSDNATMTYTFDTRTSSVPIKRTVFRLGAPSPDANFTDLWWNSAESGWGLAVTQQFDTMFLAWYVYDDNGRPFWYVASNCAVNATKNGCTGTLYRMSGPPGPVANPAFDSTRVSATAVGNVTLSFTDYNTGMLSYTVNGSSGSKAIARLRF